MKNELNKIFAASECPPGEVLRKYHEGKLFGIEKNSVEKHLASCEACSDELEGMFFINNNLNLDKTVAGLKENINVRLGIDRKKNSFPFYVKIAAVITILFIASVIIYITINSNQTISTNALSLNTDAEKTKKENSFEQNIKAEEEKAETSDKSMSAKGVKSVEKESDLKSETQLLKNVNPIQQGVVAGSTSDNKKQESAKDEFLGVLAENKKELEKIDKKENSQDGSGAGVSNTVTHTGLGKASVKTITIDASEQKVSEDQDNVSETTVVTTKTSNETSKKDNSNNNIIADNRNQNNENNKQKEEKKEQKKDESVSREKSGDELKSKTLSDDEGKKSRTEEAKNDLALEEKRIDNSSERNKNTSSGKDAKKKSKAENPKKNIASGEGELNVPSGKESEDYDQAMSKYKSGKYDEAVNLFQQVIAVNSTDYKALFYEAVCYYEQNKIQKAIGNFELVINLTSDEFADDARWYIALSHIKLNNKETARKKLQEIISKGGKHKAKAEKKIDEIK